jgi:hypothetical protein
VGLDVVCQSDFSILHVYVKVVLTTGRFLEIVDQALGPLLHNLLLNLTQ